MIVIAIGNSFVSLFFGENHRNLAANEIYVLIFLRAFFRYTWEQQRCRLKLLYRKTRSNGSTVFVLASLSATQYLSILLYFCGGAAFSDFS